MDVFYSWQADTPSKNGRAFIRHALDLAIDQLASDLDLSEADRPNVDQDTQGVLGSPPIAETIFEKIRNSDVVVLDVTLVGETPAGKKLINSNVAYELGYSHGHHGDAVLLKVMNTHYGSTSNLPFDLQHRRWPLTFDLSPDATKAQRRDAKEKLADELAGILKLYLEGRPQGENHEPVEATANPAMYWRSGELLLQKQHGRDYDEPLMLGYDDAEPVTFLRIWPDAPLPELSGVELSDYKNTSIQPLLGRSMGYSYDRNKYGTLTYATTQNEAVPDLVATTQVFKNREIWGVERRILSPHPGSNVDFDFVPTGAFEDGLVLSLNAYLATAWEKLGYPDRVHVAAGLVNVENFMLAVKNDWDRFQGPLFEDVYVQASVTKGDEGSINAALLSIFRAVYDAAGLHRQQDINPKVNG